MTNQVRSGVLRGYIIEPVDEAKSDPWVLNLSAVNAAVQHVCHP
jgi:hypothetical protein